MAGEVKLAIIGGDLRMLVAAKTLSSAGFEVAVFGLDTFEGDIGGATRARELEGAVGGAAAVILPLPFSADGITVNCPLTRCEIRISQVIAAAGTGAYLLGGQLTDAVYTPAKARGLRAIDYYAPEEVSVLNAVPSAEGAIAIAINELPVTLHGAKAATVGYGRIGKLLSKLLLAAGAQVTVFARSREALAWADAYGCRAVPMDKMSMELFDFDVIFNTVPHILFDAEALSQVRSDALMIDLASNPGGVDRDAVRNLGVRYIRALSLPGKTAPVTAGRIIAGAITNIIAQEGITRL